jgi:hypothetical protein
MRRSLTPFQQDFEDLHGPVISVTYEPVVDLSEAEPVVPRWATFLALGSWFVILSLGCLMLCGFLVFLAWLLTSMFLGPIAGGAAAVAMAITLALLFRQTWRTPRISSRS